jgi:hypothetical protein
MNIEIKGLFKGILSSFQCVHNSTEQQMEVEFLHLLLRKLKRMEDALILVKANSAFEATDKRWH